MNKLQEVIEYIRVNLDGWRKRTLKEAQTRMIVIDRVLEVLGWDLRDPDEVELEYPTVDNKSVDYALKLNQKPALLVEAKPLDDPLTDVKAITQVVGYAANDGIVWCVLTNGVRWQVYRSIEKCPAPDKLMYEVSLDPRDSDQLTVDQIAAQLWRLSRDEMAKGTLDQLGEQTFTDGKVRKAMQKIMVAPPRSLLRAVQESTDDPSLTTEKIKASLARIWADSPIVGQPQGRTASATRMPPILRDKIRAGERARGPRMPKGDYDELSHTGGMPQEVIELYRAIDRTCLSIRPNEIEKRCLAKYIAYSFGKQVFCSLHVYNRLSAHLLSDFCGFPARLRVSRRSRWRGRRGA